MHDHAHIYAGTFAPPPCCPTYTVMPGDTVTSVATDKAVLPTLLSLFNNIPDGVLLSPGEILQIPCGVYIEYLLELQASLFLAPQGE